jgi:hypothetical protein
MKAKHEIELAGIDLLLWGAIGILSLMLVALLVPDIWSLCLWLWKWLWIVLDVRNWPYWVWTCIGVAVLCILVWLRSRYE